MLEFFKANPYEQMQGNMKYVPLKTSNNISKKYGRAVCFGYKLPLHSLVAR